MRAHEVDYPFIDVDCDVYKNMLKYACLVAAFQRGNAHEVCIQRKRYKLLKKTREQYT